MKGFFIISCAAVILSSTTASSQAVNHGLQIKTLIKSDIVLTASKKRRGLAGQSGNVRKRGPRGRNPCAKAYNNYIAASGHSAYAQTPSRGYAGGGICGAAYNGRSIEIAEKAAMHNCLRGMKKYKFEVHGKCAIFASK